MKRIILVSFIILALFTTNATAGSEFEFKFFGINPADFKGRNAVKVVLGGVASHIVHEFGHYAIGKALNMDVEYKPFDKSVHVNHHQQHSDDDLSLFYAGGFIATTVVGTVITALPSTRHSDYTLGFVGFSTIHDTVYGLTGGTGGADNSDVYNLDDVGKDGTAIALTSGVYAGILTYISANKIKK